MSSLFLINIRPPPFRDHRLSLAQSQFYFLFSLYLYPPCSADKVGDSYERLVPTRLHGVSSQNTIIAIVTAVITARRSVQLYWLERETLLLSQVHGY
jgi:hypothetical protein